MRDFFQTLGRCAGALGAALSFAATGCSLPTPRQQPSTPAPQHTNRLAHESSPYLLQHAHNPVDWYPWGEEAFAKAKREDKPVFLSIGYAACHWCHVMERESFEDEEVARLLNNGFVSIKVDREERPDVDDVYMDAVQMISGRGGWPMTAFLTPEGKPFFGATYFPKEAFKKLLASVTDAWKSKRTDVNRSADSITAAIQRQARLTFADAALSSRAILQETLSTLHDQYDSRYGGFGRAPKFPPHQSFPLLFYAYEKSRDKEALGMGLGTLDVLARGGIRDHLGGGFHRYSTDEKWLVPHFEKMLYDNSLLARAYADAYRITGKSLYKEVARETLDWALRDMRGPEGGFYSSRDADSEGEEGKYYLWSRKQVIETLGPKDGVLFCQVYDVQDAGNFEVEATRQKSGLNILHLTQPLSELARKRGASGPSFLASLARMRQTLMDIRIERLPPALDDKRLTSWNALMIGSLAHSGQLLKEPRYVAAAQKAADFVLTRLYRDGRLLRRWRPVERRQEGETGRAANIPGFLEDYAYIIDALLDLYAADRDRRWLDHAAKLADTMIVLFTDKSGGFFDTPEGHETLIVRGKNGYDQAIPSANAVAARALLRLSKLGGKPAYSQQAEGTLRAFGGLTTRLPRAAQTMVLSTLLYLDEQPQATGTPTAQSKPAAGPVRVTAAFARRGKSIGEIIVKLNVAKGWHINANRPEDPSLIPTTVQLDSRSVASRSATFPVIYPTAKSLRTSFSSQPLSVFEGIVVMRMAVSTAALRGNRIYVRVRYQACDDKACLAPQTVTVPVKLR